MIEYRTSSPDEIDVLKALLWEYGPNDWNYLTPEGVDDEFRLVDSGKAVVVVAALESEIIGLAVLIDGEASPRYLEKYGNLSDMKFVCDVVVSSLHSGQGIATNLLNECLIEARKQHSSRVLIERHEENLASAGMMRKAGFQIVDQFHDPDKRTAGSQNTVILEFTL